MTPRTALRAWLLAALVGVAGVAHAAPETTAMDLVVMVDARASGTRFNEAGAGIVVDEGDRQTVIVTALHVVEDAAGREADDIQVEFRSQRGKMFPARLARSYTDASLDLAVLFVDRRTAAEPPRVIPGARDVLSPSEPQSLAEAAVHVVGAMGRQRWAESATRDHVVVGDARLLLIASEDARPGASGGAVFDSFGRVLAMSSRIDPATSQLRAIPMATIANRLRRWGLPLGLETARAGTSAPELLADMQRNLQVVVTYKPPISPPNSREALGPYGPLPYLVSARLPESLRPLSPAIDVEFDRFVARQTTVKLAPPSYEATLYEYPVVLQAHAWVTFRDGRRLGPLSATLDFESGPNTLAAALGKDAQAQLAWIRGAWSTEASNARIDHERSQQLQTQYEASKAAAELSEQPRRLRTLQDGFRDFQISCERRADGWRCGGYFGFDQSAKLMRELKLGRQPEDLPFDVQLEPAGDLRMRFMSVAEQLLSEEDSTAVYVKMTTVDGVRVGPVRLCHVVQRSRGSSARCEGH
jgi:hypothetical protein